MLIYYHEVARKPMYFSSFSFVHIVDIAFASATLALDFSVYLLHKQYGDEYYYYYYYYF